MLFGSSQIAFRHPKRAWRTCKNERILARFVAVYVVFEASMRFYVFNEQFAIGVKNFAQSGDFAHVREFAFGCIKAV